jgi:membrane associated rhomboid family serine protease
VKLKNSLTTLLIVLICGAYLVATYVPNLTFGGLGLRENLFLIKNAQFPDGSLHGVDQHEYWRIFTVALTHAGWLHLGSNMLAFFQLGNNIERYFGKVRYAIILLISLASASVISLYFAAPNIPSVGASGMIFGLFGAILVTSRKMGAEYKEVLGLVVLNLALTFVIPNIDWHAHVGGLVGGALAAWGINLLAPRFTR